MCEYGMAHSLLSAIQKIKLDHPLAASTAGSLLKPLEILTRSTVVDALQEMSEKEAKKRSASLDQAGGESSKSRTKDTSSLHLPSHPEGALDDDMLADAFADAFDADSPSSHNRDILIEEQYDSTSSEGESSSSDEDDVMMSGSESEDVDGESESDSELESDSDDDSIGDEGSEVDHMEVVDTGEDDMSDSDSEIESDDEEDDDGNDFEESYGDDFEVEGDAIDDFLEVDDEEVDEEESEEEEGWTSIDSTGHGGMMFAAPRNAAPPVGRRRQGAHMMNAAASVLSNILNSGGMQDVGEMQMEAIAEIEHHLRHFHRGDRRIRADTRTTNLDDPNLSSRNRGLVGATPLIHQNNPPDNGFSSIGSIGRNGDTNFMEYLFGGPVFGPSSVYYDLRHAGENEDEEERAHQLLPVPPSVDVQLFPGGPAASTQTRIPHSTHGLLTGVNLAPLNSLLSINRRIEDQLASRSRRPMDPYGGGWPDGLAHPRGSHIIRLPRSPMMNPMMNMNANRGPGTWDDSGQALGNAASEFSQAFERTLTNFVANSSQEQQDRTTTAASQPVETQNSTEGESLHARNDDAVEEISSQSHQGVGEQSENQSHDLNNHLSLEMTPADQNPESHVPDESSAPSRPENDADMAPAHNDSDEEISDMAVEGIGPIRNDRDNQVTAPAENLVQNETVSDAVNCPPGFDPDVFAQLPVEMQQELIEDFHTSTDVAAQLDETSGLDPEALAALPEDMRREVIEQERNERRVRQQEEEQAQPADPSLAEDIDTASFIASLAPDLREEILMTADDEFLNSLPPDILAEAQLLRERALLSRHRGEIAAAAPTERDRHGNRQPNVSDQSGATVRRGASARRRPKTKIRVDCNRTVVTYVPPQSSDDLGPLITPASMKSLIDLMFLLSPVRPQKLLQKLLQNLCAHPAIRKTMAIAFIALLNDEPRYALDAIQSLGEGSLTPGDSFSSCLIGTVPDVLDSDSTNARAFFRKNRASSAATAIAMNLPLSAKRSALIESLPPVVVRRINNAMLILTKSNSRLSLDILNNFDKIDEKEGRITCLDTLLSLLAKPKYSLSSSNLEDLLAVIESICAPLSTIMLDSIAPSKKEIDAAAAAGREYVAVPRAAVSPNMLKLLCSILRLESCKDSLFAKVSTIASYLCHVEANRQCVLEELASVAHGLGSDAIRDLRSLRIRLNNAVQVSMAPISILVLFYNLLTFKFSWNRHTKSNFVHILAMKFPMELEYLFKPCLLYQER